MSVSGSRPPPHSGQASTGGADTAGSTRKLRLVGEYYLSAGAADPERERHAVVALPRNAPVPREVLDPVPEANGHELGAPLNLVTGLEYLLLDIQHADEPLRRDRELDTGSAPLVGVDRVRDGTLAAQTTRCLQVLDHLLAGLPERQPLVAGSEIVHATVLVEHDARVEPVLLPPRDVGRVAERAAHDESRPLLGVGLLVRHDGNLVTEQRNGRVLPDEVLVALVVGVREHTDARRQEFRPRGRDDEIPVSEPERHVVEHGVVLRVLYLRLRDGGVALRAPQRRRFLPIDPALLVEVDERALRDALRPLVDGRVVLRPVDREPQALPERDEVDLVLLRQLEAHLDELLPPHVGRLDALLLLDEPLTGKPVVVEAERVVDVVTHHPPEARDDLRLHVAEDVADVDLPGHGRGGRIDAVDGAVGEPVELVDAGLVPVFLPPLLGLGRLVLLGKLHRFVLLK